MSPWRLYGPPCIFLILASTLLAVCILVRAWRETPIFFLFVLALTARAFFYLWLVSLSYHVPGTVSTRAWPGPWATYNALIPWFPPLELVLVQESLWSTSAIVCSTFGMPPWFKSGDVMKFCWLIGAFLAGVLRWLNPTPVSNIGRGAYLWVICAQFCCLTVLTCSLLLLWLARQWTFTAPEYIWRQATLWLFIGASIFGKRPQQRGDWWSTSEVQTGLQVVALSGWLAALAVFRTKPAK